MRKKRNPQRTFQELKPSWNKAKELSMIDQILNESGNLCELVAQDLNSGSSSKAGAKGMTVEQVLRAAFIKQYYQFTYRGLEDRIDDSERLRSFCRFGDEKIPRFNTLQENISRISAGTWEKINEALVRYAMKKKVETGRKVRIDTTGVETNIHRPTDARLIWDCVRVGTRLVDGCIEWFGVGVGPFHNRSRSVKKRVFRIANTKSPKVRDKSYRELLSIGRKVEAELIAVRLRLDDLKNLDFEQRLARDEFKAELDDVLAHFSTILQQCRRRVINGENVPAKEKLVSIFEPHSDIIVKGQRETLFGHKICLTGGSSNMIIGCLIERGNPADSELYLPAIKNAAATLGKTPKQVCTDDGFASQANALSAKALGVDDVVFGGKLKNELTQWVKSAWVQKQLRRFRAGIEATISAGKRAFGLDRCTWSGWQGFKSYIWLSVVAWNLQVLARHLLS